MPPPLAASFASPFVMGLLYPTIRPGHWPGMIRIAAAGALTAGLYGCVHDQVTFSISPEYFTKLKCEQFRYADFGFPTRVFVSEIGFLATSWVGFVAGWFLARIAVPAWPGPLAFKRCALGMSLVMTMALIGGTAGYLLGLRAELNLESWSDIAQDLGVDDLRAFVRVAYIHNAGYLGGFTGIVVSILRMRQVLRSCTTNTSDPSS